MSLSELLTALDDIASDATTSLANVNDAQQLEAERVRLIGAKSGRFKAVEKLMGGLDKTERPAGGKRLNEVRDLVKHLFAAATQRCEGGGEKEYAGFDPTLPGVRPTRGRLHPITQTIRQLKGIMANLGFSPVTGPEIEDTWHNFIALNIPEDHPARDPLDNFYLQAAGVDGDSAGEQPTAKGGAAVDFAAATARLLRSQTSTVQIRVMEQTPPPIRIISIGRVYRPDEADATHFPMFHQMEGLWIDRDVNLSHLKTVLRRFASAYLGSDVQIRFRPSFFPFTEPSVEVDYLWGDRWIEFGGAGIVDPHVLQHVGIDPQEWSGFAFGLGIERLCMRRYEIADIRDLFRGDIRFLRQFF